MHEMNAREMDARADLQGLMNEMIALRTEVAGSSQDEDATLRNLDHYLALRHHDLRPLQRQLMWRGLSSLGRLESRVLPTLDAVIASIAALTGQPAPFAAPTEHAFFDGEARLADATDALLGRPPEHRRSRIMVTLPSEAADNPDFILDLARRGMDTAADKLCS